MAQPETTLAAGVTNGFFSVLLNPAPASFNGAARWLDIAVRLAGSETFIPLSPRQPVTPTPYALTALKVPGIDPNALHAPDGIIANAVFVSNAGNVGIGTTSPQEKLDLRSGDGSYVRVDSMNGDIKVNGGSDGHFGIFNDGPATGGTHLIGEGQSRFFVANAGNVGIGTTAPQEKLDLRSGDDSYVRVDNVNGDIRVNGGSDGHWGIFNEGSARGGTHLIGLGQSRLYVGNDGNVGIGATLPFDRLEVRGNIRLGFDGELRATGGEENLRIVRGKVFPKGQIRAGSGFTVSHDDGSRVYVVHFTTPFATPPTVTATAERSSHNAYAIIFGVTESQFSVSFQAAWEEIESTFHFIAIGPR